MRQLKTAIAKVQTKSQTKILPIALLQVIKITKFIVKRVSDELINHIEKDTQSLIRQQADIWKQSQLRVQEIRLDRCNFFNQLKELQMSQIMANRFRINELTTVMQKIDQKNAKLMKFRRKRNHHQNQRNHHHHSKSETPTDQNTQNPNDPNTMFPLDTNPQSPIYLLENEIDSEEEDQAMSQEMLRIINEKQEITLKQIQEKSNQACMNAEYIGDQLEQEFNQKQLAVEKFIKKNAENDEKGLLKYAIKAYKLIAPQKTPCQLITQQYTRKQIFQSQFENIEIEQETIGLWMKEWNKSNPNNKITYEQSADKYYEYIANVSTLKDGKTMSECSKKNKQQKISYKKQIIALKGGALKLKDSILKEYANMKADYAETTAFKNMNDDQFSKTLLRQQLGTDGAAAVGINSLTIAGQLVSLQQLVENADLGVFFADERAGMNQKQLIEKLFEWYKICNSLVLILVSWSEKYFKDNMVLHTLISGVVASGQGLGQALFDEAIYKAQPIQQQTEAQLKINYAEKIKQITLLQKRVAYLVIYVIAMKGSPLSLADGAMPLFTIVQDIADIGLEFNKIYTAKKEQNRERTKTFSAQAIVDLKLNEFKKQVQFDQCKTVIELYDQIKEQQDRVMDVKAAKGVPDQAAIERNSALITKEMCGFNNRICFKAFNHKELIEMNHRTATQMIHERRFGIITDIVLINKMETNTLGTYINLGYVLYWSYQQSHVMICRMCNKEFAIDKINVIVTGQNYEKDQYTNYQDFIVDEQSYRFLFNRSPLEEGKSYVIDLMDAFDRLDIDKQFDQGNVQTVTYDKELYNQEDKIKNILILTCVGSYQESSQQCINQNPKYQLVQKYNGNVIHNDDEDFMNIHMIHIYGNEGDQFDEKTEVKKAQEYLKSCKFNSDSYSYKYNKVNDFHESLAIFNNQGLLKFDDNPSTVVDNLQSAYGFKNIQQETFYTVIMRAYFDREDGSTIKDELKKDENEQNDENQAIAFGKGNPLYDLITGVLCNKCDFMDHQGEAFLVKLNYDDIQVAIQNVFNMGSGVLFQQSQRASLQEALDLIKSQYFKFPSYFDDDQKLAFNIFTLKQSMIGQAGDLDESKITQDELHIDSINFTVDCKPINPDERRLQKGQYIIRNHNSVYESCEVPGEGVAIAVEQQYFLKLLVGKGQTNQGNALITMLDQSNDGYSKHLEQLKGYLPHPKLSGFITSQNKNVWMSWELWIRPQSSFGFVPLLPQSSKLGWSMWNKNSYIFDNCILSFFTIWNKAKAPENDIWSKIESKPSESDIQQVRENLFAKNLVGTIDAYRFNKDIVYHQLLLTSIFDVQRNDDDMAEVDFTWKIKNLDYMRQYWLTFASTQSPTENSTINAYDERLSMQCSDDTLIYYPLKLNQDSQSLMFDESTNVFNEKELNYDGWETYLRESNSTYSMQTPMHSIYYVEQFYNAHTADLSMDTLLTSQASTDMKIINKRILVSYGFFYLTAPHPKGYVKSKSASFQHDLQTMIKSDGVMRVIVNSIEQKSVGYRVWIRYQTVLSRNKNEFCE